MKSDHKKRERSSCRSLCATLRFSPRPFVSRFVPRRLDDEDGTGSVYCFHYKRPLSPLSSHVGEGELREAEASGEDGRERKERGENGVKSPGGWVSVCPLTRTKTGRHQELGEFCFSPDAAAHLDVCLCVFTNSRRVSRIVQVNAGKIMHRRVPGDGTLLP